MNSLVAALAIVSCAAAAAMLTEPQARARAIKILQGDPYGKTPTEVAKAIKDIRFAQDGKTFRCGAAKGPIWELHIVVAVENKDQFDHGVIDGFLDLDARTGKLLCANLPMLD
jgi:hypothetical protein